MPCAIGVTMSSNWRMNDWRIGYCLIKLSSESLLRICSEMLVSIVSAKYLNEGSATRYDELYLM